MKNAIVYLIRGTVSSLKGFERSIELLKVNFLPWSPADIIVFHEADFDPSELKSRYRDLPISFATVDFSAVPEGLENTPVSGRGYRHMCHFFANDIFRRPELSEYRYQMRLDDDSFILSPVKFNVFDEMARGGYRYGYRAVISDKASFCQGLWPTAAQYFASVGSVRGFSQIRELGMYYTNFEICDLEWFRGDEWQGFMTAIDRAGGIWSKRWGDAPIRYIGVQALLGDAQIRQFREIHYFHQSEWRSGHSRRLPWDLAKYYLWVIQQMLKTRFCRISARVAKCAP